MNSSLAKNIFLTNTINDELDRTCEKDGKEEQNIVQVILGDGRMAGAVVLVEGEIYENV